MSDERAWTFFQDNMEAADQAKYRFQVTSDIYRVLQSRLDGYRQSAAAIFLGVIAGLLTLDASVVAAFGKIVIGSEPIAQDHVGLVHFRIGWILLACGILVGAAFLFINYVLSTIHHYFAEMTSVVYKFDLANKVFNEGEWIAGESLYPKGFRTEKRLQIGEEQLLVWHDPSIRLFLEVIKVFFSLHFLIFVLTSEYILIGK